MKDINVLPLFWLIGVLGLIKEPCDILSNFQIRSLYNKLSCKT